MTPPKPLFEVIDKQTEKLADLEKIALNEGWAKNLIYCDMEGFSFDQDGTLILNDECGNSAYCPVGRFEIIWYGDPRKRIKP